MRNAVLFDRQLIVVTDWVPVSEWLQCVPNGCGHGEHGLVVVSSSTALIGDVILLGIPNLSSGKTGSIPILDWLVFMSSIFLFPLATLARFLS